MRPHFIPFHFPSQLLPPSPRLSSLPSHSSAPPASPALREWPPRCGRCLWRWRRRGVGAGAVRRRRRRRRRRTRCCWRTGCRGGCCRQGSRTSGSTRTAGASRRRLRPRARRASRSGCGTTPPWRGSSATAGSPRYPGSPRRTSSSGSPSAASASTSPPPASSTSTSASSSSTSPSPSSSPRRPAPPTRSSSSRHNRGGRTTTWTDRCRPARRCNDGTDSMTVSASQNQKHSFETSK